MVGAGSTPTSQKQDIGINGGPLIKQELPLDVQGGSQQPVGGALLRRAHPAFQHVHTAIDCVASSPTITLERLLLVLIEEGHTQPTAAAPLKYPPPRPPAPPPLTDGRPPASLPPLTTGPAGGGAETSSRHDEELMRSNGLAGTHTPTGRPAA